MSITTRTAIAFSVSGRYMTLGLQFISTMVLARLLTPEDIGIYSAGFSVVALAHLFRDFGLNQYIIQEKELDETKLRTTFTLSLIIAWSLGFLLFLLASTIADFFQEDGVEQLIKLISFNFFIIPFGSVTMAVLRKELRFHITTCISSLAVLLGIVVAIWTAYNGAQYLCLAYGAITETSSIVLLSYFFRPKGTKFLPSLTGAKKIFRFGSIVGVGNIITQLSTSATDALVARLLGITALGFFSRAYGAYSIFNNLFASAIYPIILPLLSRDNKNPEKLINGYLKTVAYSLVFAWPFFSFLYLYTFETIRVLYGTQWDLAIPLVKILCIAGIFVPITLFSESLFIACGKPDITLKIQIISNSVKLSLVLLASFHSLEAVCLALVGYFFTRVIAVSFYANKILNISFLDILILCRQVLPCLFAMIVPTMIAAYLMENNIESIYLRFFALASIAAIGWLAGLALSNHPFYEEIKIIFRRFVPTKSSV